MAYLQNGLAVPYNGRWTKSAVTKFIQSLMRPIRRITTTEGLLDLMMIHDAVVVAFIDVNRHRQHYQVFYQTAVKWLEKDPYQNVVFAIITGNGETSQQFGVVDNGPLIRTYLWNGTVEYDEQLPWSQPNLHQWVAAQCQQTVAQWLSPPGSKANTLAPFLKRGPALLLFTPRNMQSDSIDAYTMLRQIGLEYFNCPASQQNTEWIKEVARSYMTDLRALKRDKFSVFVADCQQTFGKGNEECGVRSAQVSITFGNIVNSSKLSSDYCPISSNGRGGECPQSGRFSSCMTAEKIVSNSAVGCDGDRPQTSMLKSEYDKRSPANLVEISGRKQCERHFSARMTKNDAAAETIFFDIVNEKERFDTILGLSCKSNRTLSLLAVDSLLYHTFAERLGVDVLLRPNKTVAFIVDHEMESTYTLNDVSSGTLIDFVYNFTINNLTRHLKTTTPSKVQRVKQQKNDGGAGAAANRAIRIREIDTTDFVEDVLLSNNVREFVFFFFNYILDFFLIFFCFFHRPSLCCSIRCSVHCVR